MSSSIKNLSIIYDAVNEENTFACGDFITGHVVLEVAKETKVDYLLIKAKGKARAVWSERHGQITVVYYDKEKYFTLENYIIQEQKGTEQDQQALVTGSGETGSNTVVPGIHEYPFTFQIPHGDMPSSFKGGYGKIVYTLEAKLGRPMRVAKKTRKKFTFISKADPNINIPQLMEPQSGTKEKKMKTFTSGSVTMDVRTERMGYLPGEEFKVTAEIDNKSSRDIVPKYCLYQKQSFFAQGRRKLSLKNVFKESGEPVPASAYKTVTKVLTVPSDVSSTILNCKVVHVEYRLKVYLDIKFTRDPEVKLPVVILPADSEAGKMVQAWPPS